MTDRQSPIVFVVNHLKEDESVAQKALAQIEEAEAAAESIRADAVRKAEEIRADAHTRGRALLAENNVAVREDRKRLLAEAEACVAKILADAGASAKEEADQLRLVSSDKLDAASQLILERIRALWQ